MSEPRIAALRTAFDAQGLDGLLVFAPEDYRYLTGFSGDAGALAVGRADALLLTDSRYIETARGEVRGARVAQHGRSPGALLADLADAVRGMGGERWGFDESVSYAVHRRLSESGLGLVPTRDLVLRQRMVKDAQELVRIRRACAIAADALEELIDRLRPGMLEREAALWLEVRMREMGAEGPAFPFIVASGPRGSLPHGAAGERALAEGDMITLDVGCRYFGYHSDLTRTVALGRPSAELQRIYAVVLEAQEAGLAAVRPGVPARAVDEAARSLIARAGYGEHFGHGTGHGVGLEVHELPRVAAGSEDVLAPGMVLTVEPGVYLPGVGGVRIEDTVLVTDAGAEVLTVSPKALRMLAAVGRERGRT